MFAGRFPLFLFVTVLMVPLGQNLNLALGYDEYAGIPVEAEAA